MNMKILTFLLAGIITIGGTTGIFAASNAAAADYTSPAQTTTATTLEETTAAETTADTTTPATGVTTVVDETTPITAATTAVPAETTAVPSETTAAVVTPTNAPLEIIETTPVVDPTTATTAPPVTEAVPTETVPATVAIDEAGAKAIALSFIGTNSIIKVELENENGIAVYEIIIETAFARIEVKIDANTGVVLSSEVKEITGEGMNDCLDKDHKLNESRKNDEAQSDNEARKAVIK